MIDLNALVSESNVSIESVDVIVYVNKKSVASEIKHTPITVTAVDPTTDAKVSVTHRAKRFERAAACPIATGRALYQGALDAGYNATLRFC